MSVKELKQYEYKCDICGRIRCSNQLPSGWVNLRSQLRTSGNYRSAEAQELNDADTTTLDLDICQDCWMYKIIEINNIYRLSSNGTGKKNQSK